MTRKLITVSVAVLLAATAPIHAQVDASAPKDDPELPNQLKQFKEAIADRRGERDQEATNLIDKMLSRYGSLHEKDQASVRKAVQEVLVSSRVRREPDHKGLFVAATYALGKMGEDGAKILVKAYKGSKFRRQEWVEMRAVILKNIGKTQDPRQIEFLLDRAGRDPEDEVLRAAGEALGNYDRADMKTRKKIAKELIKKFNEIHGQSLANLDPGDAQVKRSKDTLAAISHDWNQTLKRLTGESFNSPPDWQRFYNKNKNKEWKNR